MTRKHRPNYQGRQIEELQVYWKWHETRNDRLAHAMVDRFGVTTMCGQHMSIYGPANVDDRRCSDCERAIREIERRRPVLELFK